MYDTTLLRLSLNRPQAGRIYANTARLLLLLLHLPRRLYERGEGTGSTSLSLLPVTAQGRQQRERREAENGEDEEKVGGVEKGGQPVVRGGGGGRPRLRCCGSASGRHGEGDEAASGQGVQQAVAAGEEAEAGWHGGTAEGGAVRLDCAGEAEEGEAQHRHEVEGELERGAGRARRSKEAHWLQQRREGQCGGWRKADSRLLSVRRGDQRCGVVDDGDEQVGTVQQQLNQ